MSNRVDDELRPLVDKDSDGPPATVSERQEQSSADERVSESAETQRNRRLVRLLRTSEPKEIKNHLGRIFRGKSSDEARKIANDKDEKGQTMLHLVASFVLTESVDAAIGLLIGKGSDIDSQDRIEQTPLQCAVRWNNSLAAASLLRLKLEQTRPGQSAEESEAEKRKEFQSRYGDRRTLFMTACAQNSKEMIRVLLNHPKLFFPPDSDEPVYEYFEADKHKNTFLHYLAKCNETTFLVFFEETIKDEEYVHLWKKVVQRFISSRNKAKLTPFEIVVQRGFADVVDRISGWLKWDPDVELFRNNPNDEQESSSQRDDPAQRLETIRRANPHLLHLAAAAGNERSFALLHEKLKYVHNERNEKSSGFETPAHLAARHNNIAIMRKLIEIAKSSTQVSLFETNQQEMTPLMVTAQTNAWDCASALIDHGYNQGIAPDELYFGKEMEEKEGKENEQKRKRESLLTIATAYKHPEFVTKLVRKILEKDHMGTMYLRESV